MGAWEEEGRVLRGGGIVIGKVNDLRTSTQRKLKVAVNGKGCRSQDRCIG